MSFINKIRQELLTDFANKDLEVTLESLQNILPSENDVYFDLLLIVNEFNEIKQENFHGVTFYEQIQVRINRIRKKLLELIRGLKETDLFGFTNIDGIIKYKDARDNQCYDFVEMFDQIWLTQNLNFNTEGDSWFYNDDPKNAEKYGRLYTWEAAQMACIPGCRLPTEEDIDQLVKNFDEHFPHGYKSLERKKECFGRLKLIPGGGRRFEDNYQGLIDHGYYWSSSESSKSTIGKVYRASYYHVDKSSVRPYLNSQGQVGSGLSCRCLIN